MTELEVTNQEIGYESEKTRTQLILKTMVTRQQCLVKNRTEVCYVSSENVVIGRDDLPQFLVAFY